MDHGSTTIAGAGADRALATRIETQTRYLIEMMRRLGVSSGDARREADRAGLVGAAIACAECDAREACGRLLARKDALEAPPDFCPNRAFLEACARRAISEAS
ncbi:DUF6455 family protein [Salinarimonas sp.]|uniref:DUF6455 family protein n=1 Tax=Salinarimonas sp. TaxID=2766526 RepID=UPI00391DCD5F